MQDANNILADYAEQQGWNDVTQLDLCLQYISNQCDNTTFAVFLAAQVDAENSAARFG